MSLAQIYDVIFSNMEGLHEKPRLWEKTTEVIAFFRNGNIKNK